jgi:hypothetical protein
VTKSELLTDPAPYKEFFAKLAKPPASRRMSYKVAARSRASAGARALALAGCESGLHDFSKPPESPAKLAAMRAASSRPATSRRRSARRSPRCRTRLRRRPRRLRRRLVSGAKADEYLYAGPSPPRRPAPAGCSSARCSVTMSRRARARAVSENLRDSCAPPRLDALPAD